MLRAILADRFYRDNATVFATSMAVAALNFLLHPVLARLLTVEDYGEVQAMLALASGISIFLGVFGSAAMNIVANADGHDHSGAAERMRVITALRNVVAALAAAFVAGTVLLSGWLGRFLNFESPVPIVGLAFTFALSVPFMFRASFLRGSRRFFELGQTQAVQAGAKLVAVAAFAAAGLRAAGAAAGILVGQLAALSFVARRTREFRFAPGVGLSFDPAVLREMRFAGLVLAVSAANVFMATSDVLVVKHYFDPAAAGAYAGVAVVGRIALFITGSAGATLQPSVRLKADPAENQRLLRKSLLVILLLGGATFLAFLAAPGLFIRLVVGERFVSGQALLPWLAGLMLVTSVASNLLAYYVALRQRFAGLAGLAAIALVVALCVADHSSPMAVVRNYYAGALLIIAATGVRWTYVWFRHLRPRPAAV